MQSQHLTVSSRKTRNNLTIAYGVKSMEWNGRKSLGIKAISTFSLNGRAGT